MMPTFTPAQQFYPVDNIADSVPKLEAFQAKAVLAQYGVLEPVLELIYHPDTPIKIKLAWENSVPFRRDNPMVLWIADELSWSSGFLDELFSVGALITPDVL